VISLGRVVRTTAFALAAGVVLTSAMAAEGSNTDRQLQEALRRAGFTGRIESTLEQRLGRAVDPDLADLGRLLFFDKIGALHSDNSCSGCHAPNAGFGDTQSIAIGIQNNNLVGPNREGPRNQRRTPSVVNTAFYPRLMWNGRFHAPSGDPFDNSQGFTFPAPEGTTRFPANDAKITHLLMAQGELPPTELVEVAGFTGTAGTIAPEFDQFDDGLGFVVPPPDASGFRNDPIRAVLLEHLNANPGYRELFARSFPEVGQGAPIDFSMFGRAIAEFEFALVFADAPIDRFARGDVRAMGQDEKRGALLFFGKAGCVSCHAVAGPANEMFSDFTNRVIGVPQVAPFFGAGEGNIIFDGPGQDEDFGAEQISGDPEDRYRFRTSPLRNAALQPAFFHNGSFTNLEDAIRHHLDVGASVQVYDPLQAGVDRDLCFRVGPMSPVLARLDPGIVRSVHLNPGEIKSLVSFVRDSLLDDRARPENLCRQVPESVPSGLSLAVFEGCEGAGPRLSRVTPGSARSLPGSRGPGSGPAPAPMAAVGPPDSNP
jgi:cytochrome c peroxidase